MNFQELRQRARSLEQHIQSKLMLGASSDVESLLQELNECISTMAEHIDPSNPYMTQTLQRNRDALLDLTKEFRKQSSQPSYTSRQERSDMESYLLQERHKIDASSIMTDQVIDQAYETRQELNRQRSMLTGATRRLQGTLQRFPLIHSLVSRIQTRTTKNQLVLGITIGLGCCFLLWWMFG